MPSDPEMLTLVCANCGRIFASSMQMEPSTFEQIRLNGQMELCPRCGRTSRYSKTDYLFRSSDPSQWGQPPVLGEH